ncbi:MAG: U32 family peptidase, partial [Alistipes sp.]
VENVTNHMAEQFYRDHGVQTIERGLDLEPSTTGHCVMRTAYCLRREIGECLREESQLRGNLYLERGNNRYRLEFDCVKCEMRLMDESDKK